MAAIIIHTGLPGSGKTLNAIKELFEDSQFENRQVYYYGLEGCTVDHWIELTEQELLEWWKLPDASVIFVDEAQRVWRDRPRGSKVPESVEQMETTRHLGITFMITCQFPTQLDIGVRGLCGLHRHYERIFNSQFVKVIEYGKCKTAPTSNAEKKEAVIKRITLDKKYFGYYKSANIHVEKSRIPFFVWILLVIVIGVVPFAFYAKHLIMGTFTPDPVKTDSVVSSSVSSVPSVKQDRAVGFADQLKPALVGHPFTAPFYRDLVKASVYPKISGCMQFFTCTCNTQQGTVIHDMPEAICERYVQEGVFDFNPGEDDQKVSEFLPSGAPCCGTHKSS